MSVSHENYCGKLKGSCCGISMGVFCLFSGLALACWNEYRSVANMKTISAAREDFYEGTCSPIMPELEGKLVHVTCPLSNLQVLGDADPLLVDIPEEERRGLRLDSYMEVYQWQERKTTTSKKDKLGGGTTTTTSYTYNRVWSTTVPASISSFFNQGATCKAQNSNQNCVNWNPAVVEPWWTPSEYYLGKRTIDVSQGVQAGDYVVPVAALPGFGDPVVLTPTCNAAGGSTTSTPIGTVAPSSKPTNVSSSTSNIFAQNDSSESGPTPSPTNTTNNDVNVTGAPTLSPTTYTTNNDVNVTGGPTLSPTTNTTNNDVNVTGGPTLSPIDNTTNNDVNDPSEGATTNNDVSNPPNETTQPTEAPNGAATGEFSRPTGRKLQTGTPFPCAPGRATIQGSKLYWQQTDSNNYTVDYLTRSYTVMKADTVSVLAEQRGNTFVQWTSPYDDDYGIFLLVDENQTTTEMIDDQEARNVGLTWFLRIFSLIIVVVGLYQITSPIAVLGDIIPVIGPMIGDMIGKIMWGVSFCFGCCCWSFVVGLSWIAYRPVIGIPLLVGSCCLCGAGGYAANQNHLRRQKMKRQEAEMNAASAASKQADADADAEAGMATEEYNGHEAVTADDAKVIDEKSGDEDDNQSEEEEVEIGFAEEYTPEPETK